MVLNYKIVGLNNFFSESMKIGLGFFCSTHDNRLSTNHRIKLKNLNEENILKTFQKNSEDFIKLLELSKSMNLTIFRLGSYFIPFASHPSFKEEWKKIIEKKIRELSKEVKKYNIRITMHPGQYVVLNSPKENIIERSLEELRYHFWVLDNLEIDKNGIVVIHAGGVYENKKESLKRLGEVIEENKWLRKRLVIENDEKNYNVSEILDFAETYEIPIVFDYYHHILNPSEFSVDRLLDTWKNRIPEMHLSSKPEKESRFGEHGDYVNPKDFIDFLNIFRDFRIDLIIEAKKKELAIRKLIKDLEINYSKNF